MDYRREEEKEEAKKLSLSISPYISFIIALRITNNDNDDDDGSVFMKFTHVYIIKVKCNAPNDILTVVSAARNSLDSSFAGSSTQCVYVSTRNVDLSLFICNSFFFLSSS